MNVPLESFTFSPDISRYAYFVGGNLREGGTVWVDGKNTDLVGTFTFSPDSKHVAIVGYRPADNKRGLFIDGKFAFSAELNVIYRAFTPDSQHLFWMTREPAKGPDAAPGAYEFVTYLDGKPVARCEQRAEAQAILMPRGFGAFTQTPPAWNVGPDGALTFLGPVGDEIKRFKVMPAADTSIATMLATAK
jgi:hypothetical protein